jgi:hypothetical protein
MLGTKMGETLPLKSSPNGTAYAKDYPNRIRSLARGPVKSIHLNYADKFHPEFGEALQGFPFLETLIITGDPINGYQNDDMIFLLEMVAENQTIKKFQVDFHFFDPEWLEPLTKMPSLESLQLNYVAELRNPEKYSKSPDLVARKLLDITSRILSLNELHLKNLQFEGISKSLRAAFANQNRIKLVLTD